VPFYNHRSLYNNREYYDRPYELSGESFHDSTHTDDSFAVGMGSDHKEATTEYPE